MYWEYCITFTAVKWDSYYFLLLMLPMLAIFLGAIELYRTDSISGLGAVEGTVAVGVFLVSWILQIRPLVRLGKELWMIYFNHSHPFWKRKKNTDV